jgi:N-acetylglucosaminyldiphosphoundecaprenol N-acetyl-beta-D-mannosaminyltransferase
MTFANFAGVRVDAVTYAELLEAVASWVKDKDAPSRHIAPINAYCVSLAVRNERLRRIYARADIAGPDGMPFVFWIRRLVRADCDRMYAPDIVEELAKQGEETGWTFYLYGGSPETCLGTKRHIQRRFPRARIVGAYSPPFRPMTDAEDEAFCAEMATLKPDIVCVGLGTPKQDFWIDEHRHRIRGAVFVGCGATFDFFGGRIRMAPRLIQRSGFEWLWRLLSPDFFRLWHRYTVMHGVFLWHFSLQLLGLRHNPIIEEPRLRSTEDP